MSTRSKQSNFVNPDINPCIEESDLSYKCINDNLYDYSQCTLYFENYKRCKMFWGMIRKKRKHAGIRPLLPTKVERDEILRLRKEGNKDVFAAEIPT